jgi:hypothetical protein
MPRDLSALGTWAVTEGSMNHFFTPVGQVLIMPQAMEPAAREKPGQESQDLMDHGSGCLEEVAERLTGHAWVKPDQARQ